MSLFKKAGEKFEETKQAYLGGKEAEYACRSCENTVDGDYEHCPHCGEDSIEPVA